MTDPATQPLVGVPLSPSQTGGLCIESPGTIYIRRSRFIWVSCLHRSFASKGSNTVSISIKERQVKRPFSFAPSHQQARTRTRLRIRVLRKDSLRIRQRIRKCNVSTPVPNCVRQCEPTLRSPVLFLCGTSVIPICAQRYT